MNNAAALMNPAAGATPLDPDEVEGLLPSHITTHEQLNAWEQLNIARADAWAMSRRRRAAAIVLTADFAESLHRRMFDETWNWAGTYRKSGKNIGVAASIVRTALRERISDAVHWLAHDVYSIDEAATRLHHQLVVVHPWPNGNGRWARLMSDALLHSLGQPRFSWGAGLVTPRAAYLASLKQADRGDVGPLLAFARQ